MKNAKTLNENNTEGRSFRDSRFGRFCAKNTLTLFLIALCVLLALANDTFPTPKNLSNVSMQIAINSMIATGMTFMILTGGIDLSVGSVACLAGVVAAITAKSLGDGITLGSVALIIVGVSVSMGVVCGGAVGICVAKLNVAPFIATLAMLSIARGAAYVVSGGTTVTSLPAAFKEFGQFRLFGAIPMLAIVMSTLMIAAYIVLTRTPFGRHVHAVGSNEEVAYLSGVNTSGVKIMTYVIGAFCASLGGISLTSKLGSAMGSMANGYELDAIAAVVLGGTSLNGGKGGIGHTFIGCLTIGVINNGMSLIGVNSYWQKIILGAIIAFAVILDRFRDSGRGR
jgi:ribose transport system permease protein/inositol transport system permease protein